MNKKFTPEEIKEASHLLAKKGIREMGFLMLGGPGRPFSKALILSMQ